jgi:hypothetical protein
MYYICHVRNKQKMFNNLNDKTMTMEEARFLAMMLGEYRVNNSKLGKVCITFEVEVDYISFCKQKIYAKYYDSIDLYEDTEKLRRKISYSNDTTREDILKLSDLIDEITENYDMVCDNYDTLNAIINNK